MFKSFEDKNGNLWYAVREWAELGVVENGYKGWLEDRRPASNADPYMVSAVIIDTVKSAVGVAALAHK